MSPEHGSSEHSQSSHKDQHYLTGFEVFSSETIQTQVRMVSHPHVNVNEKWKVFVDKIVELQDKNQNLVLENAEIKRALTSVRVSAEKIDALETKNLQLEVENRKLKRICESLQMSITGQNPYDRRLYHFYSNV